MESYFQTQGIVLQSFPFKERDEILTLFTPSGLLKLYVKGKRNTQRGLTVPLTLGEYLYVPGKRDLHQFFEGAILHQHLKIRDRYETLKAAEELVHAILASQWPGKPAPRLFALLCFFLEHLPSLDSPAYLVSTFFLKILHHEGVLQLEGICRECEKQPQKRWAGERMCIDHAPPSSCFFSEEEEKLLHILVTGRSLKEITSYPQDKDFLEKSTLLFKQAFDVN